MTRKDFRVALVGLDGITNDIILKTLTHTTKLPAMTNIVKHCSLIKNLASTTPYITPVSWASISTGIDMSQIGIFDFFIYKITHNKIQVEPVKASHIRAPRLWDVLAKKYKTFNIVVNVPPFYPAEPIRGIMVAGFPAPKLSAWPPYVMNLLRKYEYKVYVNTEALELKSTELVNELIDVVYSRTLFTIELLKRVDWNFLFIVYLAPDTIMHKYGKFIYRYLFKDTKRGVSRKYFMYMVSILSIIDKLLRELLELCDVIILISDHGNIPVEREIFINELLLRIGTLKVKRVNRDTMTHFMKWNIFKLYSKILRNIGSIDIGASLKLINRMLLRIQSISHEMIDVEKSNAFAVGTIQPCTILITRSSMSRRVLKAFDDMRILNKKIIKKDFPKGNINGKWRIYVLEANEGFVFNPLRIGALSAPSIRQCDHSKNCMFIAWNKDDVINTEKSPITITHIFDYVIELFKINM
ncbi:MAG: hypothetical protein DRN15_09735 [Thermoprotei archaeon]|nr:MAG: hypothetical protein DRN15_09735 [Thermoprotei archaeon]